VKTQFLGAVTHGWRWSICDLIAACSHQQMSFAEQAFMAASGGVPYNRGRREETAAQAKAARRSKCDISRRRIRL